MEIELNFINESNQPDTEVVIFAKDVAGDADTAIAWTVIQHCGKGDSHAFGYSEPSIAYSDSWGNLTRQLVAAAGQQFSAVSTISGDEIVPSGSANEPDEIDLVNKLTKGAIDALLYNDGRLIASKTSVAPLQTAVFKPTPILWIGLVSGVEQGAVMDWAILATIDTEISLYGIASADIVMTGGGVGPDAEPVLFTLQNVVMG
jgi:hypothetical protein